MYLLSTAGGVTGYKNVNFGKPTGAANKSIEINMPYSNYGYLFAKWISPALPNAVSLEKEYNWIFSFYGNTTGKSYFYLEFLLYRSGRESLIERSSRSEAMFENITRFIWQYHFKRALSFIRGDRVVLAVYAQCGSAGQAEFFYDCAMFPSYFSDPTESRFMRNDDTTVNGLTAKKLGTAQSVGGLSTSTTVASVAQESIFYPTSNYQIQLTAYPTTSNYDKVDDPKGSPDDSATYVRSNDTDTIWVDFYGNNGTGYTLTASKKIAFLYVTIRGYVATSSTIKGQAGFCWLLSGTEYDSDSLWTTTGYATKNLFYNYNPKTTLEWTQADVRAMRFGCWAVSAYRISWRYGYITQVFVESYIYTDQTVYFGLDVIKKTSAGVETNIGSKVAQWSASYSSLQWDPTVYVERTSTWSCPSTALAVTDSIVIQVYSKVGAGAWTWQQNFTTEQLGASNLDSNTWTVSYYEASTADISNIFLSFGYGDCYQRNARIEGFKWTSSIVKTWTTAATWEQDFRARSWGTSAFWTIFLQARQWTTPAIWELDFKTRQWSTSAVWMFNLLARQWTTAATWTIQLLIRQWRNTAIWSFNLINEIIGAYWHNSAIWSIVLSLDTMTIHDLAIMLVLGLIFFPMCIIFVAVWLRRRH